MATVKNKQARASLKRPLPEEPEANSDEEQLDYSDEEGGYRVDDIYIPPPPRPALTTEDIGPRLIITKIVNEWFKSYAGIRTVGPLHKRFNAVIGPNGSGKSNVIDSMLFVFGYRASRIRSKKISSLIHNSTTYQNVPSCTVSVHFVQITDKENDEYEIIPGSEFVVSRTANRDNSSFYQLGGRRIQFKDVAVLLRKHGIDLDHNRFLILQGEVEQIAMMKCKAENEHETGMLEYLEDVIGTVRYKAPLEKLLERHNILTDKRNEKVNRVKLSENEMNTLKEPMEEAVEYLKLENDIIMAQNILIQKEIQSIEGELSEKSADKDQIQLELDGVLEKLKELQTKQEEKKKVYTNLLKTHSTVEETQEKCRLAFSKLSNKDVELRADMEETNKMRKKMKKQLEDEKKKIVDFTELPEKAAKSIEELHIREGTLVCQKEKLHKEKQGILATIKDCTKDLQERRGDLETDLLELRSHVDEAKSAFTVAESELKIYTGNEETEQKKLEDLKSIYENVKKSVVDRKREVDSLKKDVPTTERALQSAVHEYEKITTKQHELTAEIRKKTSSLETVRSSMQAFRSRGRVLDSLTRQKQEGKCPGFIGRLGDLGGIDKKYDVAVSTACGPLDHIVVDAVDTAQWCIEFLKKHDIGRASFIALDKQEHLRQASNSTIQTPEAVPRLYDLIKIPDQRVKPAFYFALRDTLVANNLDQASRIAYGAKRYRVVTLAGDLIETSGTMSGGGKTVSRGRMGQSVTVSDVQPQEMQRMETDLLGMEEKYRLNQERYRVLETEINTLKPKLKEMKLALNKHTAELESLKTQEPNLLQQVNDQTNKMKSKKLDPKEVQRLSKLVQDKKETYEDAEGNASRVQVQVDAITKEINSKTSGRLQAVDKKINETSKQLNTIRAEITKTKVSVTTADRNLKKCEEKVITIGKDITNAENRLRDMKAKRDEIETDGAQIMEHIQGLAEQLEENETELKELKKAIAELDKEENVRKGEKIEIEAKMKTVDKSLGELLALVHGQRAALSKLQYHDIPDQTMQELKTYTAEELEEKDEKNLKHEIASCKQAIQQKKPNFLAIKEYKNKRNDYIERVSELDVVSQQRNKIGSAYDNLKGRRKTEFLTGFRIIKSKLKQMYQMITLGGDADLEIIDSYDPFTEGVKFNVRPPRKPWKNISNLSGGEKTLSSLALVFALHYFKPSPLYVMDEIDAALDFKNVSIVAHYIKERTKNAQFIVISLRPNMFELANYMVGICKVHDCTRAITIHVTSQTKFKLVKPRNLDLSSNTMQEIITRENGTVEDHELNEENNYDTSHSVEDDSEDVIVEDSFSTDEDNAMEVSNVDENGKVNGDETLSHTIVGGVVQMDVDS